MTVSSFRLSDPSVQFCVSECTSDNSTFIITEQESFQETERYRQQDQMQGGRVLRACFDQLAPGDLQLLLGPSSGCHVLQRVHRRPCPKEATVRLTQWFLRCPVAPMVMKCLERLVRDHVTPSLPVTIDPLQFAYQTNRSTDDAMSHLLHTSPRHWQRGSRVTCLCWLQVFSTPLCGGTHGERGAADSV